SKRRNPSSTRILRRKPGTIPIANECARCILNSGLPTKRETAMWCKKVEFELDRFIFVAPKPIPEEEWTKLREQYGEHQTRVFVGDALLIDLRGKEPTF